MFEQVREFFPWFGGGGASDDERVSLFFVSVMWDGCGVGVGYGIGWCRWWVDGVRVSVVGCVGGGGGWVCVCVGEGGFGDGGCGSVGVVCIGFIGVLVGCNCGGGCGSFGGCAVGVFEDSS